MSQLKHIKITDFVPAKGSKGQDVNLSYQLFGKKLYSAPIVLVNHALTGNSDVAGENGWWNDLVGKNKVIDTDQFTILSFNIPGNGFDGNDDNLIENYKDFAARDIANIFLIGLKELELKELFALIGGSLGGGIAWEMAVLNPTITKNLITIATDWKSTDWLIANCQIQEQFLSNSCNPVHDARMHAMLCYRTPESFKERFQRSKNDDLEIFKKNAKDRWELQTSEEKIDRQKRAGEALRRASTEGSKAEKFVYEHLTKAGYEVIMHKVGLIPGEKYEVDLFLPSMRVAIEIDGPQHFLPIYGEKNLRNNIKYDAIKNGALISRGICVIRIKYLLRS